MNRCDSNGPTSKGHLNPGASPPISRYAAPADLTDTVRHFWVPEWDLPPGASVASRVLSYPALNLVVEAGGAVLAGPTTSASERVLEGRGWAVGALLLPAATPALGYDGTALVDSVLVLEAPSLVRAVTACMSGSSPAEQRHRTAVEVLSEWLRQARDPLPELGLLANAAVRVVEREPEVTHVAELAERLNVTPRTLQRALRRCTGFTPSEVIGRRRLQDAADLIASDGTADLADVAHRAGFADHAHMTRSFRAAIRETPSRFRDSSRGGL